MFNEDKLQHFLAGAAIAVATFLAMLGLVGSTFGQNLSTGAVATLAGWMLATAAGHMKEAWDERRAEQGRKVDPLDAAATEAGGMVGTLFALVIYVLFLGAQRGPF